jgi:PAS domain S-box-containing protein
MLDNQRLIRLLLDFDQSISVREIQPVIKNALLFFDTHYKLYGTSIILLDQDRPYFTVFTGDTSLAPFSSGSRHPISDLRLPQGENETTPTYNSILSHIPQPGSITKVLIQAGVQSSYEIPLVIGGEVIGFMIFGSSRIDGIPDETQDIAMLLASRLSSALFHARLYDKLSEQEESLKNSVRSYRELIDQAADVILRATFNGEIIQANMAATRLLGYSNQELLNMNLSALFEPDVLVRKPLRYDLLKEGLTVLAERAFRAKGGNHIPVEMNSKKLSDGTLVSIVRDLSERNKAKERLLDQRNQITALFDATPTPMYAKDPQGRYTMLNEAYLNFFGKTREDMLGKKVTEIWNTPSAVQVEKDDLKLLQDQEIQTLDTEFKNAAGVMRQMLARKAIYKDTQGNPAGFVGTLLDYTDLKNAQNRYETLFNNSPDPIVVHDGKVVLTANRAAQEFLKAKDPNKYIKSPVSTFIHPDSMAESRTRINDLLSSNQPNKPVSQKFIIATGEVRDVEVMSVPLEDHGRVVIMSSFRDVTEIASARVELAENRELLELIVDTIPGLFSYSNMHEKYLYVNEAYANWYGYKKKDVIGKSFDQILPKETYLEIQPYLSRVSTGEGLSYSRTAVGPDGRPHDLHIRYLPHFDTNQQPKAFLTSIQDVTEQNERERFGDSLRRLARQLTVSLEPREVGVIAATLLYDLFKYDAFALYQINLEKKQAVGVFAQDTFSGEDRPVEVATEVNDLELKHSPATFILPAPKLINRKEGTGKPNNAPFGDSTRRSLSLVFVPVFWEGNQIGSFTLQSYTAKHFKKDDLQKLKVFANQIGGALVRAQADEHIHRQTLELIARERELETSIKEKDILLKEVYHRTKNNMQVIVGLLEMRRLKAENNETQTLIGEMTNQIYSMSMVHDLLYRSKNLSEIRLDTYLGNLVDRLILAYKTSLGSITSECSPAKIKVNIDIAIPLGLVVNEIVSNALKYAFPGQRDGKIIVKTRKFGKNGLSLEVGDNGVGLTPGQDIKGAGTFGVRIIQDIVELQLSGSFKITSNKGVKYFIAIPSLKLD